MLTTTLRLIGSLAVVVGLMILLARVAGRRMRGTQGSVVRVMHRQPLTRGSGVAVVEVAGRVLVLGTTEQQVSLITELDPFELDTEPDAQPAGGGAHASVSPLFPSLAIGSSAVSVAMATLSAIDAQTAGGTDVAPAPITTPSPARGGSHRAARPVAHGSALSGSILAPTTWRQAVAAVTGRAS
ncbi:MAG: FliO/MopB family protein [Marmoricola sp.]